MKKLVSLLLSLALILSAITIMPLGASAEGTPTNQSPLLTLDIDADKKGVDISPDMIGLFFEDINYSFDGGIYPEKVNNRSFEFFNVNKIDEDDIHTKKWTPIGEATFEAANEPGFGMNDNNTYYLVLDIVNPGDGISNEGFQGVSINAGEKYDISMYIKGEKASENITVKVEKDGKVYAQGTMGEAEDSKYGQWKKLTGEMYAEESIDGAVINFYFPSAGRYYIDFVSVYPQATYNNRENGLRADFVEILKAVNPGFLRFPGGCVVEGNSKLAQRYQWKKSIGPLEEREVNSNRWGNNNDPYYYMTYGFGYYEYLLLCEDIGAKPIPVLHGGVACSGEVVPWEDMEWYVQDALDLIEFCNGDSNDPNQPWAQKRAEMGHPEPFNIEYIAFGNENEGQDFLDRYTMIAEAIKGKYPEMKLIGSAGRGAAYGDLGAIWQVEWCMQNTDTTYSVDEHLYKNIDYYTTASNRYDVYDRSSGLKVFAGEYACRSDAYLNSALGDAAFMTGFERNADLVTLACYAPLFAKYGYESWNPDLIWFNNTQVVGTPTYWVQQMYGNNMGDYTLENELIYNDQLPVSGAFGFETNGTTAQFKDLKVVDNTTGKVLYNPQAEDIIASNTEISGQWSVNNDAIAQSDIETAPAKIIMPGAYENYTATFKVTKNSQKSTSSTVGFYFNYIDENNYYVLRATEKQYARMAVYHVVNGVSELVGKPDGDCSMFTVGNECEIKLVNDGKNFYVYVTNDPNAYDIYKDGYEGLRTYGDFMSSNPDTKVYSTVSYDKENSEVIVKLVNYTDKEYATQINLNGIDNVSSKARRILLQNDDLMAGNDLDNPLNVAPIEDIIDGVSNSFVYTQPKHSFTILRISALDDTQNILSVADINQTVKLNTKPQLPDTIDVIKADGTQDTAKVTWEERPDSLYSVPGSCIIYGDIEGSNITAKAYITIEDIPQVIEVNNDQGAAVNEPFEVEIITNDSALDIAIKNEYGSDIGKTIKDVRYENGNFIWTVELAIGTKGDRVLPIWILDENGEFIDSGKTINIGITINTVDKDVKAEIISASAPRVVIANNIFTVNIITSTGVSDIILYSTPTCVLGKIAAYEDIGGQRIWTIKTSMGTKGIRNIAIKALDYTGTVIEQEENIKISVIK